jgi:hypothetical protein
MAVIKLFTLKGDFMSVKKFIPEVDYGVTNALQTLPPQVVVSPRKPGLMGRAPTTADTNYAIGTEWVWTTTNELFFLTSIVSGLANWLQVVTNGGGGSLLFLALPDTTANFGVGYISFGGVPFISDYGTNNNFIGKGAGNATLDVGAAVGNTGVGATALADLTTGAANTAVGYSAGALITTGSNNTGVGQNALEMMVSGSSNTAIGHSALALATVSNLTAVGSGALASNTTGTFNTAVGTNALADIATANSSTAFGYNALTLTTVGDNTAVGANALSADTTGARNTAVGSSASAGSVAGSDNTAVGYHSLTTNISGNSNTAVGSSALAQGAGSSNTAVGASALTVGLAGSNSTAVGANALAAQTTAASNTAIGSAALAAVTSSSTNIAVGVSAGALLATGAGDNMFIGHQAGNALLTGANNLIVGFQAGQAYTGAESSNILVANNGVAAESNVMRIGTTGGGAGQVAKCFVAGSRGITTDANDAVALLISSTGQLGTTSSSARYKDDIQDMGDFSSDIMKARPVTFYYKSDKSKEIVPGLIAEEVAKLYPDMVVYDDEGRPETIQYQDLPVMLLNELQKLQARVAALESK